MAWTASAMFRTWPLAVMGQGQTAASLPAGWTGLAGTDVINVALFNNTGTPNKDATLANSAYAVDQWVVGNEVTDTSGGAHWNAGGIALASRTLTNPSTGVMMFDAADTAGTGNVTITNAFGCLVYDNTITAGTGGVAKEGICFNFFGAGQSVTAGTFTIVWNASGIFQISV